MAILKAKDISKMSEKERKEKIKELKVELIRNKLGKSKANAKEIKKTIARLLTFNRLKKSIDEK